MLDNGARCLELQLRSVERTCQQRHTLIIDEEHGGLSGDNKVKEGENCTGQDALQLIAKVSRSEKTLIIERLIVANE